MGDLGILAASRQEVSSYPNISYACSVDDQQSTISIIKTLLAERDPLVELVRWSQNVAEHFSEFPSRSMTFSPDLTSVEGVLPRESVLKLKQIVDLATFNAKGLLLAVRAI